MGRRRRRAPIMEASGDDVEARKVCRYDTGSLRDDGFCETGGGYPYGPACRFPCPNCRKPLQWDGSCQHCFGLGMGAPGERYIPGDRYELHDDHGKPRGDGKHWVLVEKGPRPSMLG